MSTFKKKFIAILFLSSLAVGGSFFLFLLVLNETQKNMEEIAAAQQEISASEEKRAAISKAKTLFAQYESAITRINNVYVNKDSPVEFIEEIERLAEKTRNNLALAIDSPASDGSFLGFQITLEAIEKNALDFLSLIELLPYEIIITELHFQKIEQGSSSARETESKRIVEKNPDTRMHLKIRVGTQK